MDAVCCLWLLPVGSSTIALGFPAPYAPPATPRLHGQLEEVKAEHSAQQQSMESLVQELNHKLAKQVTEVGTRQGSWALRGRGGPGPVVEQGSDEGAMTVRYKIG